MRTRTVPRATSIAVLVALGMLLALAIPTAAAPTTLTATLEGETEVSATCAPPTVCGDADGTGTATVTVDPAAGTLCYVINVSGIEPATAAHIHEAPPGSPGPVQVTLTTPDASGASNDCATPDDYNAAQVPDVNAFLTDLAAYPQNYYVNVHNTPYPDGALRGQLAAAPAPTASPTAAPTASPTATAAASASPAATALPNAAIAPIGSPWAPAVILVAAALALAGGTGMLLTMRRRTR